MNNSIADFVSYEQSYHQKAISIVNTLNSQGGNNSYASQVIVDNLVSLFEDRDDKERITRDDIQSYMTHTMTGYNLACSDKNQKNVTPRIAQEILEAKLNTLYNKALSMIVLIEKQGENYQTMINEGAILQKGICKTNNILTI